MKKRLAKTCQVQTCIFFDPMCCCSCFIAEHRREPILFSSTCPIRPAWKKLKAMINPNEWVKFNRDAWNAYQRDWRKRNKKYFNRYVKAYRLRNKERIRKIRAEWWKKKRGSV